MGFLESLNLYANAVTADNTRRIADALAPQARDPRLPAHIAPGSLAAMLYLATYRPVAPVPIVLRREEIE